ncbi:MAG: metallophosphoesterase family protein [Labilithrix sp.]
MRLGLIGDVHAEDDLLARTLDELSHARVDRVLCTGDLVDGLGSVDRACALLRERNVMVVRGNHDRWIKSDELRTLPHAHRMTDLAADTITFLKELPQTLSLELGSGGRLLLCHGVGSNDMCKLTPDDYGYAISANEDLLGLLFDPTVHVMVGGHTHKPMLRRFERARGKTPLWVVNPGTLARESAPGYAILDLGRASVDFYRFEDASEKARHQTTAMMPV